MEDTTSNINQNQGQTWESYSRYVIEELLRLHKGLEEARETLNTIKLESVKENALIRSEMAKELNLLKDTLNHEVTDTNKTLLERIATLEKTTNDKIDPLEVTVNSMQTKIKTWAAIGAAFFAIAGGVISTVISQLLNK